MLDGHSLPFGALMKQTSRRQKNIVEKSNDWVVAPKFRGRLAGSGRGELAWLRRLTRGAARLVPASTIKVSQLRLHCP